MNFRSLFSWPRWPRFFFPKSSSGLTCDSRKVESQSVIGVILSHSRLGANIWLWHMTTWIFMCYTGSFRRRGWSKLHRNNPHWPGLITGSENQLSNCCVAYLVRPPLPAPCPGWTQRTSECPWKAAGTAGRRGTGGICGNCRAGAPCFRWTTPPCGGRNAPPVPRRTSRSPPTPVSSGQPADLDGARVGSNSGTWTLADATDPSDVDAFTSTDLRFLLHPLGSGCLPSAPGSAAGLPAVCWAGCSLHPQAVTGRANTNPHDVIQKYTVWSSDKVSM